MHVTILGHAGVLVESGASTVLVDPVLHDQPVAAGCIAHAFGRELSLEAMPAPTVIVVTHAHFDHFDPASLGQLPRATSIVLPEDRPLAERVRALGFSDIRLLRPWDRFSQGNLTLTATPSATDIDEFGLMLDGGGDRYWHIGDSEPTAADAQRIRGQGLRPAVTSVKYQPSRTPFAPFRNLGASFDKEEVIGWLETVASVEPQLAFPYASSIRYCGHYSWMNRYAFPYSATEAADLLERRLRPQGHAAVVQPGDVIAIDDGKARLCPQSSPFVRHRPDRDVDLSWEPVDVSSLPGLPGPAASAELEARVDQLMRDELAPWLASRIARRSPAFRKFRDYEVVWQLAIHLGGGERRLYSMDFGADRLTIERGSDARANYFVHVSGGTLLEILKGERRADGLAFGDARYCEKIISVKDGKLWVPPETGWDLFESLVDPFTRYLRYTRAGVA